MLYYVLPVALLIAVCLGLTTPAGAEQILYDFGKGFDAAKLPARDLKLSLTERDGKPALRVDTGHAQAWPGLDLPAPGGKWDLSEYEWIAADVRNVGTNEATVHLRVDNPGANGVTDCLTGNLTLKPGQTGTIQVSLERAHPKLQELKLFGMRGSPVGAMGQRVIKPENIINLVIFMNRPEEDYPFELSNVRAGGKHVMPPEADIDAATFFPFIDEFGQYIHRDWPGKTHSLDDFAGRKAAEAEDLKARPGPEGWDQYGGWAAGPQLQATGFFRAVKYQGKWWLVDPEGRLFWSHGTDCVNSGEGNTPIGDRDPWYRNLPPADGEFKPCYGKSGYAVHGYYVGKQTPTFDFGRANLMRKYGPDYAGPFADISHRRLRSWGLNTIANWSDASIYLLRRTPYVVSLGTGGKVLEGSEGYWSKFRDVFDPEFAISIKTRMAREAGKSAGDPWCLGYFVDNELTWGDETYLALATLASPPEQAAKQAFLADLQAKYGSIDTLNATWGTQHASWEALQAFRGAPDKTKAAADLRAFVYHTAETYFKTIRDAIRDVAPQNLYLGCRFAWVSNVVAEAATKHCDIVSYNLYRTSVADFKLPVQADVPVIIGEFHFGALDRGMFHTGLVPVANQQARAEAYRQYVQGALRNPTLVGTGWFKYADEATTGRPLDEENYQIGLVDCCDTPYPETIAAVREVGYGMYGLRSGTK